MSGHDDARHKPRREARAAIVLAWLLLGEVASPITIAGGALSIGGVVVARSTR